VLFNIRQALHMLAFTAAILIFNDVYIHMYYIFFILDVYKYSCEVHLRIVRYYCVNILDKFSKNTQIWNCMKTHPLGAELSLADRPIDRYDEANSRFDFLNFEDAPKYEVYLKYNLPVLFKFNRGVVKITAFFTVRDSLFAHEFKTSTRYYVTYVHFSIYLPKLNLTFILLCNNRHKSRGMAWISEC
jgi:hypothetical protein